MVATKFIKPKSDSRWLTYLALSCVVNLLLVFAIPVHEPPRAASEVPMLKVSLTALAAPASTPTQRSDTPSPSPTAFKKIKTNPHGTKKVALTVKPPQELRTAKPVISRPSSNQGKQISTVIHEASYRKQTPPVYPRRAFELGQQGTVMLRAEITPNGVPHVLKIAKSSGHRLLDMAALAAVKTWQFEPTNINGNIVTSWVRVPVRFVIQ